MSDNTVAVLPSSTYAIVVGIGSYKDARIPKLNYTHADAQAFYNLLLNTEHAGLKKENVKLLLDEDATLFNFKNVITGWLFENAKADSTVLIYFAGHGGLESDKTGSEKDGIAKYLLPWDCNRDNLFASALSRTEFDQLISTIQTKRLIFFMDSCYAGGVTRTGARDIGIADDFSNKLAEGEGRIVIASAKPNQRSWEDAGIGHGIFTYHLLQALEGKADYDNDGYVSLWEVFKYLQNNVSNSVRKLSQAVQEPILTGDLANDIFLTVNTTRLVEKSKEMRLKRQRLSEIYENDTINLDVYTQALKLLNKQDFELNDKEKKLKGNLNAFLSGGLTTGTFKDNWEMITQIPDKTVGSTQQSRDIDTSLSKKKYCRNCGNLLKPNQVYCSRCGKRID